LYRKWRPVTWTVLKRIRARYLDNSGVTHSNKPAEMSLQVTGCEEIRDGYRRSVDNPDMYSNTAYRKNADRIMDPWVRLLIGVASKESKTMLNQQD
jgi:hypothetical protein